MNTPRMKGGFTVTGLVTGGWLVEDIRVSVPHGVAVYIPADQAYKSKDLWRAIQQGRVFPLTGGAGLAVEPPTTKTLEKDPDVAELEAENKKLRHQLGETKRQKDALHQSVQSMQGQLNSILSVLGRIENGEISVAIVTAPQTTSSVTLAAAQPEPNLAVGGEVPQFIPDNLSPEDAKASIDVKSEVVEGSSVSSTAKLLRQARSRAKG